MPGVVVSPRGRICVLPLSIKSAVQLAEACVVFERLNRGVLVLP